MTWRDEDLQSSGCPSAFCEDVFAEGDRVVVRFTAKGTHKGDLMGVAPSGKPIVVTGISIVRIAGGKIVEEWESFDQLGMMQQIGAIPGAAEAVE